ITAAELDIVIDRPIPSQLHSIDVVQGLPTGTVALNDTADPDGETTSVTGVTNGLNQAGTVGTALSGQYGTLIINSDDSYSYVADNATALANAPSGSKPVDTFFYVRADNNDLAPASDQLQFNIDRLPNPVADTDALLNGRPASGHVLANDGDLDGDN